MPSAITPMRYRRLRMRLRVAVEKPLRQFLVACNRDKDVRHAATVLSGYNA